MLCCSVIYSMMGTTTASATDPCAELRSAARAANAAAEVSIRDLRELHRKDEELIARVTAQRDDAFTKAKTAPAPWLSDEIVFALGFVAGGASMFFAARALR
jgi:hypothetical protein